MSISRKDVQVYKQKDLVLQVNPNYDSSKLDLDAWDSFLYKLCENREFQIEAIKNSIIFLASDKYAITEELIFENYKKNEQLQAKYNPFDEYIRQIQLPKKLFANIDLATGTGKSYVIYGIAQIMLGLGLVDRVLVLCPSITIESGLKEKFEKLSGNKIIKDSIPQNAQYKNPRIVDANITVKNGDICVENIHSVYKRAGSSINDSFKGQGERVLVLNDESHHIFNRISGTPKEAKGIKIWKNFLLNPDFNFKYILGFTGTAYHENDYFNDVIYRYSLRDAIHDRIVKNIDYVQKDDSLNAGEKFQKIYQNHKENIDRYPKVKPLSIFVTSKVSKAKELRENFLKFLAKEEGVSEKALEEKVLIVTSNAEHASNALKLRTVDEKDDPIEWIVSVSMLTEGWDVKNVFQIVPWEDRAFNSKLLIAQVLGRGLRIPEAYNSVQPKVIIFNHDSWSRNIASLVDEILEIETRVTSEIIENGDRSKYHFDVYNLEYDKEEVEEEISEARKIFNYTRIEKEGITLNSQAIETEGNTVYETAVGGFERERNYLIQHETWTVKKVIDKIYEEFEIRNWEDKILQLGKEYYTQKDLPPREKIEEIIKKSMLNVNIKGGSLVIKNVHKILNTFATLLRKKQKTLVPKIKINDSIRISTKGMYKESFGVGNFKRDYTLFHSDNWENDIISDGQKEALEQVIKGDDFPRSAAVEENNFYFKTPLNFVFTNFEPERKFVKFLCKDNNSHKIDSWVKSRDRGFYSIEYRFRYGSKASKTRLFTGKTFNPDFFIKLTRDDIEYILVIETKSDGDCSVENIAKYNYGKKHFKRLNEKLAEEGINQKYIFHFLSPADYSTFFQHLESGELLEGQEKFRCALETLLEEGEVSNEPSFADV